MPDLLCRPWSLALVLCCLACFVPGPASAEEDEAEGEGAKDEVQLEPAEAERAKELADALKKASKKKDAGDILPALEKIDGLRDESFEKPLLKLMNHENGTVAVRATELLEERRNEKLLKKMWKNLRHKNNDKRYIVRAIVYRAQGREEPLDKKQWKELERDFRWMVGNPQAHFADPVIAICRYAELSGDKRMARMLAEQLDEPMATNPNDPNNPPAEWWERRHNMWRPTKAPAATALKTLTGEEFQTTEAAKAWIEANEDAGFEW